MQNWGGGGTNKEYYGFSEVAYFGVTFFVSVAVVLA